MTPRCRTFGIEGVGHETLERQLPLDDGMEMVRDVLGERPAVG
jgi:hypothetical protein